MNAGSATASEIVTSGLADLDDELARYNLEGHWNLGSGAVQREPKPWADPYLWRWADIRRLLWRAGEIREIEGGASRRTVRLCTPGNRTRWTTPTIHASVQLVKPGEVAEAHRHTMGAFRFVIEGEGGYTTVEGNKLRMAPGDLILTPSWARHEHGHDGGKPMIWIDVHDFPFTNDVNCLFFETGAQAGQQLPPTDLRTASAHTPYTYPGADHLQKVDSDSDLDSVDVALGRTLRYVPVDNCRSTLPTMLCSLHRLAVGAVLGAHRTTANRIYHVVKGRGRTKTSSTVLAWGTGDIFVVPGWTWHRHTPEADTVLFSVSDEPILEGFGLLRREDQPLL